jgi:hypothetical protein
MTQRLINRGSGLEVPAGQIWAMPPSTNNSVPVM